MALRTRRASASGDASARFRNASCTARELAAVIAPPGLRSAISDVFIRGSYALARVQGHTTWEERSMTSESVKASGGPIKMSGPTGAASYDATAEIAR
jgi:hypothetical protein